jgi:hypothetical protein
MVVPSKSTPASHPSYSEEIDTSVRRRGVRFASRADIDSWLRERRATIEGPFLLVAESGRKYVLQDAVRVLGPRHGSDLFGMMGRIVALSELFSLGASVSPTSLRIGNAEYDLQMGFLVFVLGS